jgi:transcription initiation factor IIE alpha subunit
MKRETENKEIIKLKNSGLGYKSIAKQTGISVNTVRSIIRKYMGKEGFCRNCGEPLTGNGKQQFCSRHCRYEWHKQNGEILTGSVNYEQKCKYCGNTFHSYGNSKRKYCSHECYIKDRYGEIKK